MCRDAAQRNVKGFLREPFLNGALIDVISIG